MEKCNHSLNPITCSNPYITKSHGVCHKTTAYPPFAPPSDPATDTRSYAQPHCHLQNPGIPRLHVENPNRTDPQPQARRAVLHPRKPQNHARPVEKESDGIATRIGPRSPVKCRDALAPVACVFVSWRRGRYRNGGGARRAGGLPSAMNQGPVTVIGASVLDPRIVILLEDDLSNIEASKSDNWMPGVVASVESKLGACCLSCRQNCWLSRSHDRPNWKQSRN